MPAPPRDPNAPRGLDVGEPAGAGWPRIRSVAAAVHAGHGHHRRDRGCRRGPVRPADHRLGRVGDILPDVVGALPLAAVRSLAADELLDTAADRAGRRRPRARTPSPRAAWSSPATATRSSAVPSDGWAQLLLYRRDLFAAAGLPEPRRTPRSSRRRQTLNTRRRRRVRGATAAGDAFTQQTFEHLALANGCELVDEAEGHARLAAVRATPSPSTTTWPRTTRSGQPGRRHTRATYFAGKAAMIIWSSFILDELAGLRDDALPSCPQCKSVTRGSWPRTAASSPRSRARTAERRRSYGEVRLLGDDDLGAEGPGGEVHRVHDVRRLPGLARHRARGQGADPAGHQARRHVVPGRPGRRSRPASTPRRRCPTSTTPDVLDAVQQAPETFSRWGLHAGPGRAGRRHAGRSCRCRRRSPT